MQRDSSRLPWISYGFSQFSLQIAYLFAVEFYVIVVGYLVPEFSSVGFRIRHCQRAGLSNYGSKPLAFRRWCLERELGNIERIIGARWHYPREQPEKIVGKPSIFRAGPVSRNPIHDIWA